MANNKDVLCKQRLWDCFSFKEGCCTLLTDTEFGSKVCPFYATQSQVDKARQKAYDRLVAKGASPLIDKYSSARIAGEEA